MKKLYFTFLVLTLFACNTKDENKQIILSGTYTGIPDNNLIILGNSFKNEINLHPDGAFTDTLTLPYDGAYSIRGIKQSFYLESNKNLSFTTNAQTPNQITFAGELASENEYLNQKSNANTSVLGDNPRELYALTENEYVAKINELINTFTELLNTSKIKSENFKTNESKSIEYTQAYMLKIYPIYHKFITGDENFTVSENYPKINEAINYDDAQAFNFSPSYRQLVQLNFDENIEKQVKDGVNEDDAIIKTLKALKSQNIKNSLIKNAAYSLNANTENLETVYNEYMALSTDNEFKTELTEKYNALKNLIKGAPSPTFTYENYKGGTTSLSDLKGKYVYIDVWATWCGPCLAEIPALKEVEKKYHNKNIEFVSISIDQKKDYEKWKTFVKTKELAGIQLYADNAWQSKFVKDYAIDGIPRFILIDPNGNIVSSDAPRPSDTKLITLFDDLKI
jgi:thiol-disulfide isomerase/thioredoxin